MNASSASCEYLALAFDSVSEFSIWGQYFSSQKLMLSTLHSNFENSAPWKCGYFYVEAFQIDLMSGTMYLGVGTRNFFPQSTHINDDIT